MDVQTFRALHRYGAILSIAATIGAVLAYLIGGILSPLVFPLGFFGPLSGFYFIGAVLEDTPAYQILGEELMRGVVWYGGSLLGWSFILTSSTVLPATPVTALGFPAITALGLAFLMTGIRTTSGLDLKVQSEGGQLLIAITGAIIGGFIVLYSIFVEGWSPLLFLVYILATVGGLLAWRYLWRQTHGDSQNT